MISGLMYKTLAVNGLRIEIYTALRLLIAINFSSSLLQETLVRNQLNLRQRQDLEKTWAQQAYKKRTQEIESKLRARSPGLLLQEQCDKYSRCCQCTRHQVNCGQSNVWSETRYVSGSRLMV